MNVALIIRANAQTSLGGDWVQLVSTAKYLRRLDVNIDIKSSGESIDYERYELLHFFNLIRPDDILKHTRKTSKPFVVSSIYVDYAEHNRKSASKMVAFLGRLIHPDTLEFIKRLARTLRNGEEWPTLEYLLRGHSGSIDKILKSCAGILPNSFSEYQRLIRDYEKPQQVEVVPNGIDTEMFRLASLPPRKANKIVCVGRIEPRKNQLNLIRALNNSPFELYVVGAASENQTGYLKQCKQEAAANIFFTGPMDHKDLAQFYATCKVHVLPSWFETTGLSSLEAGYLGCNVVITDKGDAREYFEDLAFYCDPSDPESIRNAVEQAAKAKVNPALQQKIGKEFTWEQAASSTFNMYQRVLAAS